VGHQLTKGAARATAVATLLLALVTVWPTAAKATCRGTNCTEADLDQGAVNLYAQNVVGPEPDGSFIASNVSPPIPTFAWRFRTP
jgi:hypothetical protein